MPARWRWTPRRASPAARPRAARCRWPPAPPGPRWARTPAARSACRPRCTGWWASRTPSALTPAEGCLPLSTTLDTACAITRSVRDAVLLHEVLAARRVALRGRPLRALRLALPLDVHARRPGRHRSRAPSSAASRDCAPPAPRSSNWRCRPTTAPAVSSGQIGAAESLGLAPPAPRRAPAPTTTRACCAAHPPRQRHRGGRLHRPARRRGAAGSPRSKPRPGGFDALLCPTVPIVAPPLQPLIDDDEALLRHQCAAAAQPLGRQPARRLRAVAALPGRRTSCRWA